MTQSVLLAATQRAMERPLHVTLLGSPQLTVRGTPLSLPRRQLRALCYRLAVALQPVPREQLCFLLWPDIAEAAARRNLTVLLNQLRQVLPSPDVILTHGDAILLDTSQVQSDTVAFAEAIALAAQRGELELLAAAVNLYAGSFLHGFSLPASAEFDRWIAQERQHWERRYLDTLAVLVDGYATSGAHTQAIAAAQRALAVNELAEDMHRWLIQLYAASGDRAAALRQFERCAIALERELGVSPLPETRAMYETVRDGRYADLRPETRDPKHQTPDMRQQPSMSPSSPVSRLLSPPLPLTPRTSLPTPPTPLIARRDERAAVAALLADMELSAARSAPPAPIRAAGGLRGRLDA